VGHGGASGRDRVGRARCNGGRRMASRRVGRANTRTNTKGRTITQSKTRTITRRRDKLWGSGRAVEGAVAGRGAPPVGPRPSLMTTVFAGPTGRGGQSGPPGVAAGPREAGAWVAPRCRDQGRGGLVAFLLKLHKQRGAHCERPCALCERGCVLAPPIAVRRRGMPGLLFCSARGPVDGCSGAQPSFPSGRIERVRGGLRDKDDMLGGSKFMIE
jgi:hypothetical protein